MYHGCLNWYVGHWWFCEVWFAPESQAGGQGREVQGRGSQE